MFKKKEYKRSEWMKGFLRAEQIYQRKAYSRKEVFVEDVDGQEAYDIFYRNQPEEEPWVIERNVSLEFGRGVLDYIEHRKTL